MSSTSLGPVRMRGLQRNIYKDVHRYDVIPVDPNYFPLDIMGLHFSAVESLLVLLCSLVLIFVARRYIDFRKAVHNVGFVSTIRDEYLS